jgi:hypothetical protein
MNILASYFPKKRKEHLYVTMHLASNLKVANNSTLMLYRSIIDALLMVSIIYKLRKHKIIQKTIYMYKSIGT